MPEERQNDRIWIDAVDHYVKRARRDRRRRAGRASGPYILMSAIVLALLISPFAVARTGSVLLEGKRNPSSGSATRETEIIARNKTYGTRQSNVLDGNGGGAIYGCRSKTGREPCIRSNNLDTGRAFEFETDGAEGGRIQVKAPGGRPLTTNATGVATGFNADQVDGISAGKIDFRAAAGTPNTDVLNLNGLILRASCAAGPNLIVTADTTVLNSTIHISWIRDPTNSPFYRADNNLDPGDNFEIMSPGNDNASQGTLVYTSPAGATVSVTFMSEEGAAFAGTTNCLFSGTALAG
jgi:hypothetical protein